MRIIILIMVCSCLVGLALPLVREAIQDNCSHPNQDILSVQNYGKFSFDEKDRYFITTQCQKCSRQLNGFTTKEELEKDIESGFLIK